MKPRQIRYIHPALVYCPSCRRITDHLTECHWKRYECQACKTSHILRPPRWTMRDTLAAYVSKGIYVQTPIGGW